jgi:hypothetical protein
VRQLIRLALLRLHAINECISLECFVTNLAVHGDQVATNAAGDILVVLDQRFLK